jgi:O-methyltransferase
MLGQVKRKAQSLYSKSLTHMPNAVEDRLRSRDLKKKIDDGHTLVDLDELRREYRKAVEHLHATEGTDAIGDYLEFGVYYGASLACMHDVYEELGNRSARLIGFDSFEGLPAEAGEDDDGLWKPGQFRASYAVARDHLSGRNVDWERITLVRGWFDETLTAETRMEHRLERASLIMVDCDMYSSAKLALGFCAPLIRGQAIVFFDDWNSRGLADSDLGEKRAFGEFLDMNPQLRAEPFGEYSYFGKPNGRVFRVFGT